MEGKYSETVTFVTPSPLHPSAAVNQCTPCPTCPSFRQTTVQTGSLRTSFFSRRPQRKPDEVKTIEYAMGTIQAKAVSFRPLQTQKSTPSAPSQEIWTPDSWRRKPIKQVPVYPSLEALEAVEQRLKNSPPLVFFGEVRRLQEQLAKCATGEAFLLQGGDCAETFAEFHPDNIRDTFQVLIQMSMVLMYGLQVPIVKVGRMAGQFAKPRSADTEVRDGIELPSYRGDMINGADFTSISRIADPYRMLQCYQQSTATLNMVRALAQGGYVDLRRVHEFSLDFIQSSTAAKKYADVADRIDKALGFMAACGVSPDNADFRQAEYFSSHEALLLNYEEGLTRFDKQTGKHYATSGHLLWIGDRTRQLDHAHMEYMRGIANPIGIKAGPSLSPDDLLKAIDILNPDNIPGRLTIIVRAGENKIGDVLPGFIKAVEREGKVVVWQSDPCHGNVITAKSGKKTRPFNSILSEVKQFFEIHKAEGTFPGGIHLEMTGLDVTECTGGVSEVTDEGLNHRYLTACDPRLNATQALEMAFLVADLEAKILKLHNE